MYKLCIYSTCLSSNTVGTCTVTMFSATMQTRFTLLYTKMRKRTRRVHALYEFSPFSYFASCLYSQIEKFSRKKKKYKTCATKRELRNIKKHSVIFNGKNLLILQNKPPLQNTVTSSRRCRLVIRESTPPRSTLRSAKRSGLR